MLLSASLRASRVMLPSARASDGGRATHAAVCRWQLVPLGAEQVTRAPTTTERESEDAYGYIDDTADRGAWGGYPRPQRVLP